MKERRSILFTIGIDEYESDVWKNLDNAVLDCKGLTEVLVNRYSFEEFPNSLFGKKATKKNIYDSLNTLKNFVEPRDNVIIFYAGHGNMNPHTHRGYWIPYEGTADVYTWIENSVIKDFIEDIAAQHIWLIADSCFSGTFLTKTRNVTFEITYDSLDQKKSRWMLSSGGEEKVSDGIPGSNSPFCKYLIKFLTVNTSKFTCTSEIIKYVKILTKNNSTQTPRGAYVDNIGHENGEMIFTLRAEYVKIITEITRGTASTPELRVELAKNIEAKNKLATGKEILLVKSFIKDYDYLILENFRFDDDGVKKMQFSQDQVILKSLNNKERLYLIRRFATWQGTTRYLELNDDYYKSSKVAIIHAREDIENVEEELHCIAHADYLQELIDFNRDIMSCLHCGEKISTNDSFLVEIDELDLRDSVGNVHKECLRPADRIMGQSGYEGLEDSNLVNFDFNRWISLLQKGQGQLKAINNRFDNISIAVVSWNPDHNRNEGNYCIREHYENGDVHFVKLGKEIHRFKKEDIDAELEFFNNFLIDEKTKNNPPCMIVETKLFGSYETLIKYKTDDQSIAKVIRYEKVLYTKQYEENTTEIQNDYTPIGLVKYADSDNYIQIGNIIPLLSKPESFEVYYENWKSILENIDKCSIKIIESDFELDSYLQVFFAQDIQPIINPIFDLQEKKLKSGLIVRNFHTIIEEAQNKNSHKRKWQKNDLVEVVFPGRENEKHANGILLTDEFPDETGELCVIFQPIENGKPIKDMMFKMPTQLLRNLE